MGFMAIYAGAPMYALIMGVVTEAAKLVTTSWLYRNWDHASWKLKAPLLYFTAALMVATSIGVFGFLSKAHLEQTSGTLDNSAKIESLNFQIEREKSIIADNEKVIAQMDATVNAFLGRDRVDRSLSVRRSQAAQRNQLRNDSAEAQKRIDALSSEKFKLESEIRALQLEVGPIRYIAELIYGVEENSSKNIEAAVRIFTLLLVSTLDPLAVVLLIAANHTLVRLRNEKDAKASLPVAGSNTDRPVPEPLPGQEDLPTSVVQKAQQPEYTNTKEAGSNLQEAEIPQEVPKASVELLDETKKVIDWPTLPLHFEKTVEVSQLPEIHQPENTASTEKDITTEVPTLDNFISTEKIVAPMPVAAVRSPGPTQVLSRAKEDSADIDSTPWAQQETVLRELLGQPPHFIPKKVNEKDITDRVGSQGEEREPSGTPQVSPTSPTPSGADAPQHTSEVPKSISEINEAGRGEKSPNVKIRTADAADQDKYPKALSWLIEFKGVANE